VATQEKKTTIDTLLGGGPLAGGDSIIASKLTLKKETVQYIAAASRLKSITTSST
jgi:hypothetical protein